MAVLVVVQSVQLVIHQSYQPADGHGAFGKCFGAVGRVAHPLDQSERFETHLRDFHGIVRFLSFEHSRRFDQRCGKSINDMLLWMSLYDASIRNIGDCAEAAFLDAVTEQFQNQLHVLERLPGPQYHGQEGQADTAPELDDVRRLLGTIVCDEEEELQAVFCTNVVVHFCRTSCVGRTDISKAVPTWDDIDFGGSPDELDEIDRDDGGGGEGVDQEDEVDEV